MAALVADRASLIEIVQLDDFPARFADGLETAAGRVRALTADRLESWIRAALFLFVLLVLGCVGLVFLLVAAHRTLSIWLGPAGSLAALGGLLLIAGLFIWNMGRTASRGPS